MYIPHPHIYKLIEDDPDYDWGGITVRWRRYKCRFCSAQKRVVTGTSKW